MVVPNKRLRQKACAGPPAEPEEKMLMKSPNPRKLKQAKADLQAESATSTTASSSPGILRRSPSVDAIAKKLSFGTPKVHDIEAGNPPKSASTMTPERAREILDAVKISEGGSESSEARPGICNLWV